MASSGDFEMAIDSLEGDEAAIWSAPIDGGGPGEWQRLAAPHAAGTTPTNVVVACGRGGVMLVVTAPGMSEQWYAGQP